MKILRCTGWSPALAYGSRLHRFVYGPPNAPRHRLLAPWARRHGERHLLEVALRLERTHIHAHWCDVLDASELHLKAFAAHLHALRRRGLIESVDNPRSHPNPFGVEQRLTAAGLAFLDESRQLKPPGPRQRPSALAGTG